MSAPAIRSASIAAVRALAERDPALPDLALVLDDERRSDALGSETRIEWLRYKPATSIVAAVRDARDAPFWVLSHIAPSKLRRSEDCARRAGAEPVRLSPRTLAGPARTDRILSGAVARVFGSAAAGLGGSDLGGSDLGGSDLIEAGLAASGLGGSAVIRYNPYRRLVLHAEDRALKLTAPGAARHAVAASLAAGGHPVLAPQRVADDAWATRWWGDGDLALRDAPALSARAGRALAGIHAAPFDGLGVQSLDPARIAHASAAAIATVLPELAPRAQALAERLSALPTARGVLCHGDWSADQVLTDGADVRIIDLDRAVVAPREHDLGAYLAAGGDDAMLDGYRDGGGSIDDGLLRAWQAFAHLQRAITPFRRGAAAWPAEIEQALERAEGLGS